MSDREHTGILETVAVTKEATQSSSSSSSVLPQLGRILCCLCGVSIMPNDAAMCIPCLQKNTDLSQLLQVHTAHEAVQCRKCEKWFQGQDSWVFHELESRGLLNLLLKRIPGLQSHDVKILDAEWIWTEPHSKRLRFSVEVLQSVLDGKMQLRTKASYEFVVKHKQCLDCIHEATEHTWGAMIQLRQAENLTTSGGHQLVENEARGKGAKQKASATTRKHHKKTFYHIEALLTKHGLHNMMSGVHVSKDGFDFYFKAKNQADKVADFLATHFPLRVKYSKKLVSRDLQSNSARYEHTINMELAPLSKHDLLLTPKSWSGGKSDFFLVHKVSSSLHCVMPFSLQTLDVNASKYFAANPPPCVVLQEKHLVPFIVLDVTPVNAFHAPALHATQHVTQKQKRKQKPSTLKSVSEHCTIASNAQGENIVAQWMLAEAVVARESDLGDNDTTFTVLTHLGHILQAGDTVMGYDLAHAVFGARQEHAVEQHGNVPDVILVHKVFPRSEKHAQKKKKSRVAPWRRPKPAAEGEEEEHQAKDAVDAAAVDADEVDEMARPEEHADALGFIEEGEDGEDEDFEDEDGEDNDEDDDDSYEDLDEEEEEADLELYEGDDLDADGWEEIGDDAVVS